MRILVTGSAGQLGRSFQRSLAGVTETLFYDLKELDLTDSAQIKRSLAELKPELVINCAAYTEVDAAEDKADLAFAVNATAPKVIAEEQARRGGAIIHISTDYVFDGTKNGEYIESDPPNPLSVYGRTKLAGEQGVAASGAAHLIFRTSWVYSYQCANFFLTMMRLFQARKELRVVADQFGAPNYVDDMVRAMLDAFILPDPAQSVARIREKSGLYNLTAGGSTSWAGYAQKILDLSRQSPVFASKILCENIVPIPASDYPTKATRPANSRLSLEKTRRELGIQLPPWDDALARCMRQYEQVEQAQTA
jgi:dTDP-4-dehydrorhamnose reductase